MKSLQYYLLVAATGIAYPTSAGADGFLRTIADSNSPVPGVSSGIEFAAFGTPVLNGSGQAVFSASLQSSTGEVTPDNDAGVWSEGRGSLRLVAREGEQSPGAPNGMVFGELHHPDPSYAFVPSINNSGSVAFWASLRPTGDVMSEYSVGIWAEAGDDLRLYARSGSPVPGSDPAATFVGPSGWFAFNDSGNAAIPTLTTAEAPGVSTAPRPGIWVGDGNTWRPVAETGMHAPGLPQTVGFSAFGKYWGGFPAMNDSGQVAFWADLWPIDGPPRFPGAAGATAGIWSDVSGTLNLIALEGRQAPGTPPGAVFHSLDSPTSIYASPVVNSAGQVAFSGALKEGSGGVNSSNTSGIWLHSNGETKLIVRGGMEAPGMPTGTIFKWFSAPAINSQGQILFTGFLDAPGVTAPNYAGVWVADFEGNVRLVAHGGQQVPGMESGQTFQSVRASAINAAGQVVIEGFGIWAEDRTGKLRLIVRSGQLIDVDDGPLESLRQISQVRFLGYSGNDDGRPSGFNDRGELAFLAGFTDGSSGVFVSQLATLPQPSTACEVCVLAVASLLHRRTRRWCNRG